MRAFITAVTRRTVLLTAVFMFAIAVSTVAAQGRGAAGGHFGGGGHVSGGAPRSHFSGSPRFDGHGDHFRGPDGRLIIRGGFFDPFFWGPYPYWDWGYPYPYGPYLYDPTSAATMKTEVTPK